jgi:hypothetical protein
MAARKSTRSTDSEESEWHELDEWGEPHLEPGDLDYPPITPIYGPPDAGRVRVHARENAITDAWIGREIALRWLRWPEQFWGEPTPPSDSRCCRLDLRNKSLTLWPDPGHSGPAIVGYQVQWRWLAASKTRQMARDAKIETLIDRIKDVWKAEQTAGAKRSGRDDLAKTLKVSRPTVQQALNAMADEQRGRGRPRKNR